MRHSAALWGLLLLLCTVSVCGISDFFGGSFAAGQRGSARDDSLYHVLGLDRSADENAIKKAYRKLAMQLHPDKGGDEEAFKKLNQAYEVLSDETLRSNYDRFGMAGVTRGGGGGSGGDNAAAQAAADLARGLFRGFGGAGFSMPLVYQLDLSLEDLFKGRDLTIPIGRIKVQVEIKPGMMTGQELILRGQFVDDRGMERDVVFRLQETRHSLFQRKNADLLLDLTISLADSILGFEKTITHLDGKKITLCSKKGECMGTGDILLLPGQGMPIYNQPKNRGRLFVRIKVDVPRKLWCNKEDAQELERILAMSGQTRSGTSVSSDQPSEGEEEKEKEGEGEGEEEGEEKGQKQQRKTHPAWNQGNQPTEAEAEAEGPEAAALKNNKVKKGIKSKDKDKAKAKTTTRTRTSTKDQRILLQRGDLSTFGGVGQEEDDENLGNPFAQFFFR